MKAAPCGAPFFVFFALLLLQGLHRLHTQRGEARTHALVALCAFAAAVIMGAFDYIWYHFGLFCLFFALMAWGIGMDREEGKGKGWM
jgi:predicted membrane protein